MLCCVSKKSAAAGIDAAELTLNRCSRVASLILVNHANESYSNSKSNLIATGNCRREEKKEDEEDLERRLSLREKADAPTVLLPCAICARTFKPQSLEKHRRICERSALKKRKPFDSAKQRIQGTELAEFAPKRETRGPSQDGSQERIRDRSPKSKSGWKQTHDQLLRALREARRENVDVPPRRQKTTTPASITTTTASSTTTTTATAATAASTLSVSSGAPTRANEKGTCPTCSRQFGIKAYDRHVAWCKERAIRLPLSPATNVAKERLEARMKYRAPILKNRRAFNREKYSPGSVGNFNAFGCKTSPTSPTSTTSTTSTTSNTAAARESLSMPACNKIQETVLNTKRTVSSTTGRLSHGGMPMAAPLTSVLPCSGSLTGSSKYCSADRNNSNIGTSAEPVVTDLQSDDPFYLAERQMNELSSTDASDRSIDPTITITDHSPSTLNSNFPLSRSPSAFVKYVGHFDLNRNSNPNRSTEKRSSVIAPPSQFDDSTSSEFSSDSTETNSLSREIFTEAFCESAASRQHRIAIDKSRPSANLDANSNSGRDKTFGNSRKILERVSGKIARPSVNRSQSVRSTSAPGPPVSQERNRSLGSSKKGNLRASGHSPAALKPATDQNSKGKKKIFVSANKNNLPMSISNLSLSSIVSSELDAKRPNYMREELTSSFEDDAASSSSFPLLRSFLKTDLAFGPSSPIDRSDRSDRSDRTDRTNAQRNSEDDEENLSSPDSYKRHDRDPTKHTVDSAYSSLNRKYSNHGRSGEDVVALGSRRFYEEDVPGSPPRCKMSKFCHECGSRFPETAKFCCECGVRRLAF
ncbi:cell wall protein DAN4 isoform X2 [Cephus cinctus]|uniref:Cell wall protein DAN4 isoform X2 n=1 Tax=Cephus cinctus TaxID=211228 RepID=A0AAJ7BT85_CEPCN|nr:cell wall protein DAN4 isoform X2 [Cephus cinctus]